MFYACWQPHRLSAVSISWADWMAMEWSDAEFLLEELREARDAEISAMQRASRKK